MRSPAGKTIKVAEAMLQARGLEPGSLGPAAPPCQPGEVVIAETAQDQGEAAKRAINILASAYDAKNDMYLYCGTTGNDDTYTLVKEDDLQSSNVKIGQKLKVQIASETVLTIRIKEVKVREGEFAYDFEVEKPTRFFFGEDEVKEIMAKSAAAGELEKRILGEV